MARPKRNNADYFSHDSGMRDDPKIKALRNKFGITGYAVWCMMLEVLTNSDFFKRSIDDIEIEILSADFGIDADLFSDILSYMLRLRLLQTGDNCEYLSQKLTDRLQPVVDKRRNSGIKGVSVTESTQSKVKKTKPKETKVKKEGNKHLDDDFETFWSDYPRKIGKGKARSSYETARKKASHDEIMRGVFISPRLKGDDPQYLPHAATWLNQESWTDEGDKVAETTIGKGESWT